MVGTCALLIVVRASKVWPAMDIDGQRTWAERIMAARRDGRTLSPITDQQPVTLSDAYAIQSFVTVARVAAGQREVGWKLGYTSAVMRRQMGIDRPNFGPLTDAMVIEDGQTVPFRLVQPRVEPEIAVRIARPVPEGVPVADVAEYVSEFRACLEIVDPVWLDYRFRIEDNTADGSSAAGVVLGPRLDTDLSIDGLRHLPVVLRQDGRDLGRGVVSDALGGPDHAVAWLSAALGRQGRSLRAGDIVITGGLTAAMPLAAGSRLEATFGTSMKVSVNGPKASAPDAMVH